MHSTLRLAPPPAAAQPVPYGPGQTQVYGRTPALGPLPLATPLMAPAAEPAFRIVPNTPAFAPNTPAFAPQYGMPVQQY